MTSAPRNRPTIIDVARVAGVSKSTVARALSGASNVNAQTREKVMKAAKATGYERNLLAQSLRSGRTGMLGLVIPDIANPFWAEVARGAQDKAAEKGASLLVFNSDWDPEQEANHLRALRCARVDGAIVNPIDSAVVDPIEDSIGALGRFGMPVVLIGSSAERFWDFSSVGSDIVQGVRLGLEYLESMGHMLPAIITGPSGRLARVKFLRVVHDFYLERNIDPTQLIIVDGEYTVASGHAAMKRILDRPGPRPTCIFGANDQMALGALLALRDAGLKCPEDVSIFGFDGIPAGLFADPGLSTITKPARGIGERAMAMLLDQVAGSTARERIVLPCQLTARGSTSDIRDAKAMRLAPIG